LTGDNHNIVIRADIDEIKESQVTLISGKLSLSTSPPLSPLLLTLIQEEAAATNQATEVSWETVCCLPPSVGTSSVLPLGPTSWWPSSPSPDPKEFCSS
jgi:hypothetical protein